MFTREYTPSIERMEEEPSLSLPCKSFARGAEDFLQNLAYFCTNDDDDDDDLRK